MKPIHIDFAPRAAWWEWGADRSLRRLWWLLCALLLLALLFASHAWWEAEQSRALDAARQADLRAQIARAGSGEAEEQIAQLASAEAVASASRHLDYPWVELLAALERSAQTGVSLMSLEYGIVRQSNKLMIEVGDISQGMDYLEALRREPSHAGLLLTRQDAAGQDGSRYRFTLELPQQVEPRTRATPEGQGR